MFDKARDMEINWGAWEEWGCRLRVSPEQNSWREWNETLLSSSIKWKHTIRTLESPREGALQGLLVVQHRYCGEVGGINQTASPGRDKWCLSQSLRAYLIQEVEPYLCRYISDQAGLSSGVQVLLSMFIYNQPTCSG